MIIFFLPPSYFRIRSLLNHWKRISWLIAATKVSQHVPKKSLLHDIKIVAANPEKSTFNRNVLQMKANDAKKKRKFSRAIHLKVIVLICFQNMEQEEDYHYSSIQSIVPSFECNMADSSLFDKQRFVLIMGTVVEFRSLGIFQVDLVKGVLK